MMCVLLWEVFAAEAAWGQQCFCLHRTSLVFQPLSYLAAFFNDGTLTLQVFLPAGAPPLPVPDIPAQLHQPVSHLGEREQLLYPRGVRAPRSVQEAAAVRGAVHKHGPAGLLQN